VCHFFGAIRLDLFRDPEEFRHDLGLLLDDLNGSTPAEGCSRVFYAGQKEHEAEVESEQCGVSITRKVYHQLQKIGHELHIKTSLKIQ